MDSKVLALLLKSQRNEISEHYIYNAQKFRYVVILKEVLRLCCP